jgi:hypothetical protein
MEVGNQAISTVVGAVVGLITAAIGFAANDAADKKWDALKAVRTITVGAAVGLSAGCKEADVLSASGVWMLMTATLGLDLAAKLIWRKGALKLSESIRALLGKK